MILECMAEKGEVIEYHMSWNKNISLNYGYFGYHSRVAIFTIAVAFWLFVEDIVSLLWPWKGSVRCV